MKKLLLFLMILVSGVAQAQLCGFDGAHGQRMLTDSAYRNIVNAAKARYTSMMQTAGQNGIQLTTGYGTEYQIPLVVHVIHTGGSVGTTYNPSTSTINSMISYLNEAYEATYASYPDTNSGGVRIPIKFVLAQRDPSGSATSGINRVDGSSLSGYSLYGVKRNGSNGATDSAVKSLSVWDPADYYNIWVVNKIDSNDGTFGTYTAGYAYFPGASASIDGTVMLATTATSGNVTLPHEIGHAFSLYHTFQGDGTGSTCPTNGNCTTDGDLVCDTEPHKRTLGFCGSGMTNTCVSATYDDAVAKNIMNYATCMDRFTPGQRTRVMDAMTNERSGLGSSLGVLAPGSYPKVAACTTTISGGNAGNGFEMGPTQVILNDLRSSSNGYTNDNYRNYVDRSKQQQANVIAGESYTLTVQTTTNRQRVQVYIDYNNDSTFSGGELVYDHTGTISNTENHTTTLTIPTSGITTCTPLRMRVLADYYTATPVTNGCGTMAYGQAEDFAIYIKPQSDTVTLTNAITSGSSPTCPTGSVTFTASASKTLSSPSYQWYLNSQAVGTNSSTYTASSLSTGTYYVQCKVTYGNGCSATDSGTTNVVTLVSGSTVTPSVSIGASPSGTVCSGTSVTFTATPTNGGTTPSYQWKVNGSNVGTNSTTYTTSSLSNGDAVTCVMTSNDACASPTTGTSNTINMSISGSVTPSVSIASGSGTTICNGASVTFTATPTNGGTAPSYQWKVNGSNVGTNSTTYTTSSLSNGDAVTCVMTSNDPCASPTTATSNTVNMTVNGTVTPSVSIGASPGSSICAGTNVTFTATPTNGGTTPSYQWKVNGSNVGSNSTTYSNSSLSNGDIVTCEMTSNAACASPTMVTSNSINMSVTATVTPSVAIASGSGTSICNGASVTFTATPTNGGTTPTYQWKVNGSNVGTNSTTYTTSSLSNGDAVTCEMTSNAACPSPATATSNTLNMTVQSSVTPSVAIASGSGTSICNGASVTFTATPNNGGTTPSYQWKVNGSNVGTNSTTYTTSSLSNGDAITCEMTSNAACASPTAATSNTLNMTVQSSVTPSVAIASGSGTSVCNGASVTFTATPTNGGASPTYQWKVNGSNVGTNSSTYTTTTLSNGNAVTCEMTSNATCASPTTATSNTINMTVQSTLTPSVAIASGSGTTICAGASVTFTATPTNGGASPTYQWKVNGSNVGTNSNTFTTTTLSNSDAVTCEMTSNATCASPATATSNTINMTVNSLITPANTISSGSGTTICTGTNVTFTAFPGNGGTSPMYQWRLNGANVGTNSNTYTNASLSNGDVITCKLTSNAACVSPDSAISNSLTMTVNPFITPSVSVAPAPNDTICDGAQVIFTATPTNGGTSPAYTWTLNGDTVSGITTNWYLTDTLNNGDQVVCEMVSNESCLTTPNATSNTVSMTVNSLIAPAVSIASNKGTIICVTDTVTFTATPTNGGTSPSYQWKVNGSNVGTNSATYTAIGLTNSDEVSCVMTSNATCASPVTGTSNTLTMTVQGTTPSVSIASSAGTTICAGTSVTFTATPANGGPTPSYQWEVNGNSVGTNSSTYVTAALSDGDTVTCIMTSSLSCSSPSVVLSNKIGMTVNPNLTPIIAISVSPNDTICAGTQVKFTSTYANQGTTPTFQWKVNGSNVGTNADSFVTTTLANNDVVTVQLTSSETCVTSSTATSNGITMTVNPNLVPVATIAVTPNDTICDAANAIFTSSIANGGTTPTYQWQVNGLSAGTNNDTFQTTGLMDGDKVRLILTSSETCLAKSGDTSNEITMTVVPNVTPVVSIAVTPNDTICAGTSVTFTATPTNGGTTPTYQWKVNGTNVGTNSTTFTTSTLTDGDVVACAMTSSLPCVTSSTAISNAITMKVNPIITPMVTIAVSPNDTICAGTTTTFTATTTNGGTAPTYQWKLNGSNVGTGGTTYLNSGLADGDVVTVEMVSNGVCLTKPGDTSNAITMSVIPNLTPVVIITKSPVDTVCEGTAVTFSATSANGGTSPTYQWQVNGSNVGTNSPTYISTTLNNGDIVRLSMTSSLVCLTKPVDTSNTVAAMVNAKKVPDVTITVAANDTLCAGNLATFTAAAVNGGTTPSYQWQVNGTNVGTNSNTYATTGLSNNDMVRCIMTTSDTCVTKTMDTSNVIEMTITPITTPDVTIAVAPDDTICDGNTATFTATATDAGTTPSYQWQVNGVNVGANSNIFVTTTLNNADVVRCIVTSSDTCVTKDKDTSNTITMTVKPNLTPVITITVAPNDTICDGTSVTFSTTVANGGTSPTYQWRINGTNVGTNSSTFSSGTLSNGDVIDCILTSSEMCVTKAKDTSNSITMTVNPNLTPEVTITVSPDDTICAGTSTTFTATPTNGGTTPTYQWQVNGSNAGANSNTFTSTTLADGDVVRCILTSSETCVTKSMDTSNVINMTVKPYLTPLVVTVVSPNDTICDGTTVTFTATGANGGTTPIYQWRVNGTNVGTNDTTYTTSSLTDKDTVRVIMTSSEMCLTKAADTSDDIVMTVNPNLTPSVTITASPNDTICDGQITSYNAVAINGGTSPTYQWKLNGTNVGINSSGYATAGLSTGDEIVCVLTSSEACVTKSMDTSNTVTMFVHPLTQPSVSILANTGTTICDGGEVKFKSNWSGGGTSQVFQWRRNGVDIAGATTDSFTTSTMTNGDVITLRMDITAECPDPDSAVSNLLAMAVVTPSVSVAVSPNDTICLNQSAMFSLTGTNVGNLPVYQWKVNGNDMVGAVADVFAMPTVNNGDKVTVSFVSSDNCINAPEVPSADTVTMVVNSTAAPTAGITANPSNVFQVGDVIWFTSSVNVPNATYQWRKNGIDIPGATGLVYNELNPKDGDTISLWIRSNDTCRTPDTAISNIVILEHASGIAQTHQLFDKVTIAPNPNNGTFVLSGVLNTVLSEEKVTVEVINTVGQVIYKEDVQLRKHELDVRIELGDKAHNGLHLIRVSAEGNKQLLKFITNR